MFEIHTPITEFLDRAIAASRSSDYLAFMTIIARQADGQFLQDELLTHWESFDDLTGEEILVLSPKANESGYDACVHHWREPAGLINERLRFGNRPTQNWDHAFWAARPVRRPEERKAYENLGGLYSPRRPRDEAEKKAAITASATETARYFGLRESSLPCVVLLSLADGKAVVITADRGFSLYATVRAALMDYEPVVSAVESRKKRIAEIVQECRNKEKQISEERSTLDRTKQAVAHTASSWAEQTQASIKMLKAVADCSPDSREFAELLAKWLNDEIDQP
jgi:Tfp pilus assembly major pilin PilA